MLPTTLDYQYLQEGMKIILDELVTNLKNFFMFYI